jgi:hypothetical protein
VQQCVCIQCTDLRHREPPIVGNRRTRFRPPGRPDPHPRRPPDSRASSGKVWPLQGVSTIAAATLPNAEFNFWTVLHEPPIETLIRSSERWPRACALAAEPTNYELRRPLRSERESLCGRAIR